MQFEFQAGKGVDKKRLYDNDMAVEACQIKCIFSGGQAISGAGMESTALLKDVFILMGSRAELERSSCCSS